MRRAALLVCSAAFAACVQEPSLEGRACSDLSPCPAGYTCGSDLVCHATCNSDDDCEAAGHSCIDSICVAILEGACGNGVCLCSGTDECPSGLDCLGGVCTRPMPDTDGGPEPSNDSGVIVPPRDSGVIVPPQDSGVIRDAGVGQDAMQGIDCGVCNSPPPSECVSNNSVFRTYSGIGSCNPQTGQCSYTSSDMNCPSCQTMCLDPCGAVSCDDFNGGCRDQGFCVPGAPGAGATCNYTNAPDDTACTVEATSQPGLCLGGDCVECRSDFDCNDNNVCTAETCDQVTHRCTRTNVSGPCTDGTACTSNDTCVNGACVPGVQVTCNNSPGACFQASGTCDPSSGLCDYAPLTGASCDDNNACTRNDSCNASGTCRGTAYSCNDSNRCTTDTCNGSGGCSYTRIAPDGLTPTGGVSINTMDVVMTWNACSNAAHYDVNIEFESSPGVWTHYFTYDENNPTAPTTPTKTLYPCGGASNARMRFRVRSYDGTTHGPWSAFSIFRWANSRTCAVGEPGWIPDR